MSDGLSDSKKCFLKSCFFCLYTPLSTPEVTKSSCGVLEEVFVLPLALLEITIDSRRKEVGSVLGMERVSVRGGLLNPLRICDRL